MSEIAEETLDEQMSLLQEIRWCKTIQQNLRDTKKCCHIRFHMRSTSDFEVSNPEVIEDLTEHLALYLAKRERKLTKQYKENMEEQRR